jgi:hypothetical protein
MVFRFYEPVEGTWTCELSVPLAEKGLVAGFSRKEIEPFRRRPFQISMVERIPVSKQEFHHRLLLPNAIRHTTDREEKGAPSSEKENR